MPNVNPGPASTSTPNTMPANVAANASGLPFPQEQNQIRLLGAVKGVNCAIAGDNQTRIINAARWVPTAVIVASSLGQTQTPTTAYLGVFTQPAGAAYTVLANAVLTNVSLVQMQYAAAANTTSVTTDQNIYVNVGTTTATGLVDVMIYGYDLSQ
jgi:hypothetical protein